MNTSGNKYDSLEELIQVEDIRIQTVDVHSEIDLLLIILNTGSVLKDRLSKYPRLIHAKREQLLHYELIANGKGIHWPELDEDLSLKGFLRETLKSQIVGDRVA